MKKHILLFLSFLFLSYLLFGNSLELFFAQDDFILINKFSQNTILTDFKNLFSFTDTHFRPIHNLYFLILGNIFEKNYTAYHIVGILVHSFASLFVYLTIKQFVGSSFAAFSGALLYLVNSSHFVSLFWISGNAVEIGFLFFCTSLLFWVNKKYLKSLTFLLLASLASESFILGYLIVIFYELLKVKNARELKWLYRGGLVFGLFAVLRFVYLTTSQIYDTYKIEVSIRTFSSLKYYLLRVAGFSEMSDDLLVSFSLLIFWGVILKRLIDAELPTFKMLFFISIIATGLIPFIFLPHHLSPHYMNMSILGSVLFVAMVFKKRTKINYLLLCLFIATSAINVFRTDNHWVVIKSRIAEAYIRQIESGSESAPDGSTLVFNNNRISSSLDAYIALGGGKAIDFWFKDKNYKYCFTEFETCSPMP